MFCTQCGTQNDPAAGQFCTYCGARLVPVPVVSAASALPAHLRSTAAESSRAVAVAAEPDPPKPVAPTPAAPPQVVPVSAPGAQLYQGVAGWLLVFTLLILFVFPAWTMYVSIRGYRDSSNVRDGLSGMRDALRQLGMENKIGGFGGMGDQMIAVSMADLLLDLGISGFAVYAGYGLMTRRPRAVKLAKIFLASLFAYSFARQIIVPNAANVSIEGAAAAMVWLWIAGGIALMYFVRSKRVRATYTAG
jgi:hypothetical protein